MGFFSWDCKGCKHSVREGHGWMSKCLVQGKDGSQATGDYDGYGKIEGSFGTIDLTDEGDFELWHHACYVLSGRPTFSGPSRTSRDQGMPPANELAEPKSADDLRALKELADAADRKAKAQAARMHECREAEHKLLGAEGKCPHCGFDTFFVVEKNGSLMIRCPNRDCLKLRAFPTERAEAWRALAAKFDDQPVIWDDRKVGPHFADANRIQHNIERYEAERKEYDDDSYVDKRLVELRVALGVATTHGQRSEQAETETLK